MDATKNEIRTFDLDVSIREVEGQPVEQSRTIVGTAIVFNAESEVLDSNGVKFREVIKPEAAQMVFLNTQDIKLNLLHERKDTIGRSRQGRGNLRISVDGKGVNFEVDVPKCDLGDRALEMVRSGVYTGCSFEFLPGNYENGDYTVEERGANKEVRVTHHKFSRISAFTLAMDPAYSQTSCNARELWNETPTAKREAEEAQRKAEEERRLAEQREEYEKLLMREREKRQTMRSMRERELELENISY